jgi:formate/nitrite transporter
MVARMVYGTVFAGVVMLHTAEAYQLNARFTTAAVRPRVAAAAAPQFAPRMQELLAPPPAGYAGAVAAGEKKANMPAKKIFTLGVISGCQIGFGAYLMLSVGGACPGLVATNPGLKQIVLGAFGLPFGLMMTILSGAELFTGNTALVTMAALEGKADTDQLTKSWVTSYAGNFVGSVAFAMLVCLGGTLAGGGASIPVAMAKTSAPFKTMFVRGILCNWLVCMAVYLASMAKDVTGKMIPIWFCISSFIALGLEHSVANMFIIPLDIFHGASVTWKAFLLNNLLPVTLGNIVGGAVCVAMAFSMAFGKLGE